MSSSIFDLVKRANEIEADLVSSGGEIDSIIEGLQADLASDLEAKSESYYHVMERLSHNAEFFRAKAKELTAAAQSLDRTEKALKETLKNGMLAMGVEEIKTPSVRFKLSKTALRLAIADERKIPQEFKILIYETDKSKVKAALEAGTEVPGASLEGGLALRSYLNKGEKR